MDDLRREKKALSPGQRNMVPGRRPLPALGGSPARNVAQGQRSPGPGVSSGQKSPVYGSGQGQRSPGMGRAQSPAAASHGVRPAGPGVGGFPSGMPSTRPMTSSPPEAANKSAPTVLPSSNPNTPSTDNNPQPQRPPAEGGDVTKSTARLSAVSLSEEPKPVQAVTVVHPKPNEGTPQRPALPKLKIRKDLIS